jgi:hypothetical protein
MYLYFNETGGKYKPSVLEFWRDSNISMDTDTIGASQEVTQATLNYVPWNMCWSLYTVSR